MNRKDNSYGLPHVTAAYTVRDEATGEYYAGSSMDINERFKTHRKKRTKAWELLERPTAYLEWVECSIEVARMLERAVFYEGGSELAANKRPPNGKAYEQMTLEAKMEKARVKARERRAKDGEHINALRRERWANRTEEQKEAKRARDRAYAAKKKERNTQKQ